MPVLIEAISVVVPKEIINSKLRGGVDAFLRMVPNSTHCTDGVLHRVGFMVPADVQSFVQALQRGGLTVLSDGRFLDAAVVDMLMGPTMPCSWLGFGRQNFFQTMHQFENHKKDFSLAWYLLEGGTHGYGIPVNSDFVFQIAVPEGWSPDKSLNSNNFIPEAELKNRLIALGNTDGVTKFWDASSQTIVYVGRPEIIT